MSRFNDFKISYPAFTSSTGSADKETRIVSPKPAHNKLPRPIADFTVPRVGNPPLLFLYEMEHPLKWRGLNRQQPLKHQKL